MAHQLLYPLVMRSAIAPVLALAAVVLAPRPAAAQAIPAPGPPNTEVRLLAGTGVTVEGAQAILNQRLRVEAGVHAFIKGAWAEGAVLVRALGSPSNALLVRAGLMAQSFPTSCGSDDSTGVDLGLSYRHRWPGRSLIAAEVGGEALSRTGRVCNDSVFSSRSSGLRFALAGQYSFTPALGLYARIGLRTAEHIPELGFLPEAWLGVAFEI
jgi:hypothetical protein